MSGGGGGGGGTSWLGTMFTGMSTGLSAEGTMLSAEAEADALKYNAGVKEQNARLAREQAQADSLQIERALYKAQGGQRAGYGASGVSGESGSALDVLADTTAQGVLDVQRRKYAGELEATGFENEAALDRYYAKKVIFNSKLSAFGQKLGGAASAFGGSNGFTYRDTTGQNRLSNQGATYRGNTYGSRSDAQYFANQDAAFSSSWSG